MLCRSFVVFLSAFTVALLLRPATALAQSEPLRIGFLTV